MRVVAGSLGGRTLAAPPGRATRPTSERVREALFSALGDVRGHRVLDLYAGTGALAIEALSRGAAYAVLVESQRAALAALHGNLDALALRERAKVLGRPVERARALLGREGPFDLVLADPPWPKLGAALALLGTWPWDELLVPGGTLAVEKTRGAVFAPERGGPFDLNERRWGDTEVVLARRR